MRAINNALAFIIGVAIIGFACYTSPQRARPLPVPVPPRVIVRYVPCMEDPPKFYRPTWPAADSIGNVLMHTSTAQKTQELISSLDHYIAVQLVRCREAAAAASR